MKKMTRIVEDKTRQGTGGNYRNPIVHIIGEFVVVKMIVIKCVVNLVIVVRQASRQNFEFWPFLKM